MSGRILHISDLHVGRSTPSEPLTALRELASQLNPELLVVTGDLTHRGRPAELEKAHDLLHGIGVAILAVPGNHDLPYVVPKRFTRTHEEWERVFGTTEPVFRSDRLAVVGLNSTRPWRHQGGALPSSALDRLVPELDGVRAGALRVVAFHHHLASPPWRVVGKRPLRRRDLVLERLASARVDLVLGGHVHQGSIAERREFDVVERDQRASLVLATVPGFGRPRPGRRKETLGFNVYEFDEESITAVTRCWAPTGGFVEVGRRSFPRTRGDVALPAIAAADRQR